MNGHGCASIATQAPGSRPPGAERDSPPTGNSNHQRLAGKTANNGRYLLLERAEGDASGLHFLARDLLGGLEVVVTLGVEADARTALQVRSVRLAARVPSLPILCSGEDLYRNDPVSEQDNGVSSGSFYRLWRRLLFGRSQGGEAPHRP